MAEKISLQDYKKAYREIVKEEERKAFMYHAIIYVVANLLLIIINIVYDPEYLWFLYPLIGWGSGITIHYLFDVRWIEKYLEKREEKAEQKAKEMMAKK